jgi:HlyD family secretion protein
MHRRPPIPVIILVIVALAVGGYYALREMQAGSDGTLSASGSIEATTVNVSPELSGKVLEVLADEGQPVTAGEPLLKLDPALLTAQRAVSAAALDSVQAALSTAQTNYDLAVQKALAQQQATQSNDWRFSAPDEFNQPAWYFNQGEQLRAAQAELESAQAGFEAANQSLSAVTSALNNADFVKAETRLANARAAFLVADTVKTNADFAAEGGGLQKAADASYNAALDELRAAQKEYNAMLSSQAARDVQEARGTLEVAQQRLDQATSRQVALQTGIHSPAVVTAEKLLDQAKTAVAQAEASLALIDTQLGKLTVASSTDGVVLTRNVEPGEFVQPGATAFSLGELSDMTITVYVPEDRYGEISIGQTAQVRVDSWPGEVFSATVVKIADQAEFTPRNVQTVEGRSSTVYAVKLSVSDPAGKLKIGMPADVVFSQ